MTAVRKVHIGAPHIGAHEACNPAESVRIVKLTSHRCGTWADYRLRWTLYANHDRIRDVAHAHATVDVWSHRDADWHQVWELGRKVESPYGVKWEPKVRDWNELLDTLAQYATEVLT